MGDIQHDPSMEDILASIKRVIADDNRSIVSGGMRRKAVRAEPAPGDDDDVLELDDPVAPASETLISDAVTAASRERLAALTAIATKPEPAASPVEPGALEAVVREMLRPMLKDWLDQNLPEIVEQLVTREITRITGRN